MSQTSTRDKAPLDEVMLAMDVVDTLRHRERVIERELGAEDRERQLMRRLREIYASQGIEVSDEVLAQGVRALREERFVYTPPEPGLGRVLAELYVTRGRWGKWVGGTAAIIAAALLAWQLGVRGPQLRAIEALPAELAAAQRAVVDIAAEPQAADEAERLAAAGEAALERGEHDAAREALAELRGLRTNLEREYELRIVSRPGELSGVWRIPEENPAAQNYYLIVEPVAPDGSTLTLPIRNEEDGRVRDVSRFGLRVDEETFQRVARDKQDDGVIQSDVVGVKRAGELEPEYRMATTGAAITEW
ncbi:MAG: hypothetical protein JXB36_18835 [Gammaproteobacteria bacterium]|nr:hypothetical protein [Gammaproteobacteria bacterium]